MARSRIGLALVLGAVTTERLAAVSVPAELRTQAQALLQQFASFKSASARADSARVLHKAASADVHVASDTLVSSVDQLAAVLIAASPGTRAHPFAPYGKFVPAKLTAGSRARAADKVTELAAAVIAAKPKGKKAVRDAADQCTKAARALHAAHTKLTPFVVELKRAREERAALAVSFTQSFEAARHLAKHVWRSDLATFNAVFGAVERYRYSPKTRKKGAVAGATPPTDVQPATGTQPVVKAPANAPAVGAAASAAAIVTAPAPVPTTPVKPASTPASTANGAGTSLSN